MRELERLGIPSTQLRLGGYGDTHPVADNATPEGRAANRRVEIVLSVAEGDVPLADVLQSPALATLRAGNLVGNPALPEPIPGIDPLATTTTMDHSAHTTETTVASHDDTEHDDGH